MDHVHAQRSRRSTLGLLASLGVTALAIQHAEARSQSRGEVAAVGFTRLVYTDAGGRELAQMRPYAMFDISHDPGVALGAGERALANSVGIWNSSDRALIVPPTAFALWGRDGRLYRPGTVFANPGAVPERETSTLDAEPIPPCSRRFGWLHFRVPADSRFRGLLFTPEPERVLILADFDTPSTAMID